MKSEEMNVKELNMNVHPERREKFLVRHLASSPDSVIK